jgi:hypothetical protein
MGGAEETHHAVMPTHHAAPLASSSAAAASSSSAETTTSAMTGMNSVTDEVEVVNLELHLATMGAILCLGSASFNVANILVANIIKKHIPLFLYTWLTTFGVLTLSCVWVLAEGDFQLDLSVHSPFGWASPDRVVNMMLFASGVCVCMACYAYSIETVPPVIFATVELVDPFLTGLTSWAMQLEGIPVWQVWAGGALSMVGGFLVIYGQYLRTRSLDHDPRLLTSSSSKDELEMENLRLEVVTPSGLSAEDESRDEEQLGGQPCPSPKHGEPVLRVASHGVREVME